jgi:hypothetical protein
MGFYTERKEYKYYQLCKKILEELSEIQQESILDIGCFDSPVSTWGNFKTRYSVDKQNRANLKNVIKIVSEWPHVSNQLPPKIDVITCLQVIEHIENYRPFVDKILEMCKTAIISIPWKWPKSLCKYHVLDPIDEDKLNIIMGKPYKQLTIFKDEDKLYRAIGIWEQTT